MWDLPRSGLEPVSPALAGGFLTTAPPGKPQSNFYKLGEDGLVSRSAGRAGFDWRALELGIYGKIWQETLALDLLGQWTLHF